MRTVRDYLYIIIATLYQILFLIILGIIIYPIFKILGNLADGISINIIDIFLDTFDIVYSKLKSGMILKMTATLIFIRVLGVCWLDWIKKTNNTHNKP